MRSTHFPKIIPYFFQYKKHPGLNFRLPNYSVKQGFGLHQGWAIEGAIGSEFKIDASYLSPNVNMAARLEAATKQFGVPLLISGALRNLMSEKCKRELRHIDRVTVKGSIEPIDLYTCDTAPNCLKPSEKQEGNQKLSDLQKKVLKNESREKKTSFYFSACENPSKVSDMFEKDPDIAVIREPFTREFHELFEMGVEAYLAGDWPKSREILQKTLVYFPHILYPYFFRRCFRGSRTAHPTRFWST